MEEHRFVFIGGLHRSGTSILFRCLREHPLVSGFQDTGVPEDEGQHLQSVFPSAEAYGGPGVFGSDPEAHLTEASDLVTDANRLKLFQEWKRYWNLNKPVLLEKSPPNLIRSRLLQAFFPRSSFVIVARHPIAVSLATQKWSWTSLDSLVEHWLTCHETFEQDRPHVGRVMVLKYEDLVTCPRAALQQVHSYLGLPDFISHQEICPDINDRYLRQWREYQQDAASEGGVEASRIRLKYAERVARFGYDLDG